MPDAPNPITSTPSQPWQPWDATESGSGDPQTQAGTVYDAKGGSGADPWVKIRDGGQIDMSSGASQPGNWPDDGSSSAGPWKQT
jgi:hypothetical protein